MSMVHIRRVMDEVHIGGFKNVNITILLIYQ